MGNTAWRRVGLAGVLCLLTGREAGATPVAFGNAGLQVDLPGEWTVSGDVAQRASPALAVGVSAEWYTSCEVHVAGRALQQASVSPLPGYVPAGYHATATSAGAAMISLCVDLQAGILAVDVVGVSTDLEAELATILTTIHAAAISVHSAGVGSTYVNLRLNKFEATLGATWKVMRDGERDVIAPMEGLAPTALISVQAAPNSCDVVLGQPSNGTRVETPAYLPYGWAAALETTSEQGWVAITCSTIEERLVIVGIAAPTALTGTEAEAVAATIGLLKSTTAVTVVGNGDETGRGGGVPRAPIVREKSVRALRLGLLYTLPSMDGVEADIGGVFGLDSVHRFREGLGVAMSGSIELAYAGGVGVDILFGFGGAYAAPRLELVATAGMGFDSYSYGNIDTEVRVYGVLNAHLATYLGKEPANRAELIGRYYTYFWTDGKGEHFQLEGRMAGKKYFGGLRFDKFGDEGVIVVNAGRVFGRDR